MIVCPVCENKQELGFECEVCGKDLAGVLGSLGAVPVKVERMSDLEVTIPDRIGEVAVERAPDVEVTSFASVGAVVVAPVPDFERTVSAKLGDVPVIPIEDISEDRVPDDGVRTAIATGPLTCRYCKNVQVVGTICETCGMKLPQVALAAVVAPGGKKKVDVWTRCKACAAPGIAGQKCRECGRDVPMPEQ